MRRSIGFVAAVLACSLAGACAGSAPGPVPPAPSANAPQTVIIPPAAPLPAPLDAAVDARAPDAAPPVAKKPQPPPLPRTGDTGISVRPKAPDGFACDADLKEWGTLAAAASVTPSHAAVVLTSGGLTMAGDLATTKGNGVWLVLSFPSAELPPIGHYQRGGGVRELSCEFQPYTDKPLSAAEKAGCEALYKRYNALKARYQAGFERRYRIDASGVRVAGDKNSLSPVSGATASLAIRDGHTRWEVTLPPSALPRCSQAPATELKVALFDEPDTSPPAPKEEQWAVVQFDPGIDFAPMGATRAMLFGHMPPYMPWTPRMSYQPGEGLPLEVTGYAKGSYMSLSANKRLLHTTGPKLGRVEVAYAFEELGAVVVFVDGIAKEVVATNSNRNVVQRNGELHVLSGYEGFDEAAGRPDAGWRVSVVSPNGAANPADLQQTGPAYGWNSVRTFHNADWSQFGMRGMADTADYKKKVPFEVLWGWDAAKRQYVQLKPAP